jgi:enoyl-CoA hydratase
LGLVDRLVDNADVLPTARQLASEIATNAPLAIRALKRALLESEGMPPDMASKIIAAHRRSLDATKDYAEGLAAFAAKRSPDFRGE